MDKTNIVRVKRDILDLLSESEGLTLTQISSSLHLPKKTCFKALKKLFTQDKIEQKGGKYYI